MELPANVSVQDMLTVAKEGSPFLVNAVGRLAGLGDDERKALAEEGVPKWAVATLAVAVGIVVGAKLYKSFPDKFPRWAVGR